VVPPIEQYAIDMAIKLRRTHGLRIADIARILNTTTSFVGNVESTANPGKYNLKHINTLAAYFGVSPRDFLPDAAIGVMKNKRA